jgi:hypothetical protein
MPAFQARAVSGRDVTTSWSGLLFDMMVDLEIIHKIMHAS